MSKEFWEFCDLTDPIYRRTLQRLAVVDETEHDLIGESEGLLRFESFRSLNSVRRRVFTITLHEQAFPVVTCGILMIGFTFMMVAFALNGGMESLSGDNANPSIGASKDAYLDIGLLSAPKMLSSSHGQVYRLMMALFLPPGFIHLLVSFVVAASYMAPLELRWGGKSALACFLALGVAGNVWSVLFLPTASGGGPLGAMCGFVGLSVGHSVLRWQQLTRRRRTAVSVSVTVAGAMLVNALPLSDNMMTIGAFLTGVALGLVVFTSQPVIGHASVLFHSFLRVAGAAVLLISLVVFPVLFFALADSSDKWCAPCGWISCYDASNWCDDYY
eukprot:Rmarinus@m.28425